MLKNKKIKHRTFIFGTISMLLLLLSVLMMFNVITGHFSSKCQENAWRVVGFTVPPLAIALSVIGLIFACKKSRRTE